MKNLTSKFLMVLAVTGFATAANAEIASKAYVDTQDALKEAVANKSGNITTDTGSTTKYTTVKAVEDYVTSSVADVVSDVTTDLSGKENISNKSGSIATDTGSTTKYTTVKAVEDHVASANATQTTNILNAVDTTLNDYSTTTEMNTAITNATSTISADVAGKADKKVPATAGNVATLDASGNLADGGTLGTAAFTASTAYATSAQGTKADATDTALTTNDTITKANTAAAGLAGKEDITNKSGNITTDTGSTTKYTTVKSVEDYVTTKVATVNTDLSGKADKAVPAVAGNVAKLDASGNLTDGGTLGALAMAAPGGCSSAQNKCVLTFDGTTYAWEVVER